MASTGQYGLWSPNVTTAYNIPASTAAMQASVETALLDVHNYHVGSRAQRTALAAPKLKKYTRFFEQDYNIEWLYTGSGWKRVGGVMPGWTNIRPSISWRSGFGFSSSTAGSAGIKARRIDDQIEMHFNNFYVNAKKFNIPTDGNINNEIVFTGIPAQFRPASGDYGAVVPAHTGGAWSGYVTPAGELILCTVAPWTTQTGSKAVNKRVFSGKTTFRAGTF